MDMEANYAEKAEMFRAAIDKQADEEIAKSTKEIRAKKTAAGKAQADRAIAEALAEVRAERGAHEMRFQKEISRCEFETVKAVRAHRKKVIDEFFEELRGELSRFTRSVHYSDYLKHSLAKAEKELGENCVVFSNAHDLDAVKKLTSHEVRTDSSIKIGGICALNEEKGLFADYTLGSALEEEREAFIDKPELRLN